jgi:hypothetical protein
MSTNGQEDGYSQRTKRDGIKDSPVALLRARGTLSPRSKTFPILIDLLNSNQQ